MTIPAPDVSDLANRYALLEELGSLAGVSFYRCAGPSPGLTAEAAVVDLSGLSAADLALLIEYVRLCSALTLDGIQRVQAYAAETERLLVISEEIRGRPVVPPRGGRLAFTPQRAVFLGIELSRIVAHLHANGIPVALLPAEAVLEVPGRGVVVRNAWLFGSIADLLRARPGAQPDLEAALPPEVARGRPPGARAGVYAVGHLLSGPLGLLGDEPGGLPPPPGLAQVLLRSTQPNARRRQRDMRALAGELARARPGERHEFRPTLRVDLPARRLRPPIRPRRLPLPERPPPESPKPKVRPWMMALVSAAGAFVFLLLAPRIANPLTPVQRTIEDIQSVFAAGIPPLSKTGPAATGAVIPGMPFPAPDFVGRQQAEVQIDAARIGLDLNVAEEFSSDSPPGAVLRQQPQPGAVLTEPYRITVVVSRGEARAFLTSVVGTTAVQARETLASLGFLVLEIPVFDKEKPAGEVVGQEPAAGQILPKGEQVVLKVSQGAQRIQVPALVGLAEADAVRLADELGLKIQATYEAEAAAGSLAGAVVAQDPPEGSPAEPDAVVVVKVYRPEPAVVPLVIGMELHEAVAALDAAGLTLASVVERETVDATRPAVIEQDPPPGTLVARDSGIKLVIAKPAPSPTPGPSPTAPPQ